MHFAVEQAKILLNCFHLFRIVWYAMAQDLLRLKNPSGNVSFAQAAGKILWEQEFPASFVVAKENTIATALQGVNNAMALVNQVMVCPAPVAGVKAFLHAENNSTHDKSRR